jgi:GNAT superfamily N-acetyltransferase
MEKASDRALIDAGLRSFFGSYRTLLAHVDGADARMFGRVFAFTTGIPISIFNCVLIDEPPDVGDVAAALDWIAAAGLPYLFCPPERLLPDLGPIADRHGLLQERWLVPHMALSPPPAAIPAPAPGVAIRSVPDGSLAGAFREAMAATGVPSWVADRLCPDALFDDDDVQGFVAELEGRPVGTSLAIRTGDVTGVYAVGTARSARRRGVGTAATWAAVEAGRSWSSPVVVLQSSELGYGVYAAMGFRTVGRFAAFAPPRD